MKSIEIIKNNKKRKILLLDDREKLLRKEAKDEIEKYLTINDNVYSFRKGKSVKMAINKIKRNIDSYKYFMKLDIENYYGTINLQKLYDLLEKNINDLELIEKIKNYLNEENEIMEGKGLFLGSPLSNILSNIYLSDVDNKYSKLNCIYVRFCDDIFILSDETELFSLLKDDIKKLDLKINERKTIIGSYGYSVKFLGEYIKKSANNKYEQLLNSDNEAEKYAYKIFALGEPYEDVVEELIEEHKYSVIEEINLLRDKYDGEDVLTNKLLDIFSIRERGYYVSNVSGKKEYIYKDKFLSKDIIKKHLNGEISLAVEIDREDDKANMVVIDIDNMSYDLKKLEAALSENNFIYYKEFSGMKGYHYWIFLDRFYTLESINNAINDIKDNSFSEIHIEIIPRNKNYDIAEKVIKLPYGRHPVSGKMSYFEGEGLEGELKLNRLKQSEKAYYDFIQEFNNKFPEGMELLNNCSAIKAIVKEGIIEKEMSHYKRIILLYIMKFLDSGIEMLHYILQNMNNYSFNITERNIEKAYNTPITCEKIKEYIKGNENGIKCTCNSREVVCPLAKVNSEKYNGILYKEEMKKVVDKIIELKNERRLMDRNITMLENKLERIYDLCGGKEAELESGKLIKKGNKWIIETEI